MSAYFLWLKDNRARLTKPGMAVTEVSKGWTYNFTIAIDLLLNNLIINNSDFIAAGAEWSTVTDKTKYEKMAAQDKVSQFILVTFKSEDFESEYNRHSDMICYDRRVDNDDMMTSL